MAISASAAIIDVLDRPGGRLVLSKLVSIRARQKTGCKTKIYYDGDWVHELPDAVYVDHKPKTTIVMPKLLDQTKDFYCYLYKPNNGHVILDIGAGIGTDTLFFSRSVGPSGKVVSIEAHPRTFSCLNKMCRYNRLRNVTCLDYAIMDKKEMVCIENRTRHISNRIIYSNGIQVSGNTLDNICEQLGLTKIDFLKMNIEGSERLAIRGMAKSLKMVRNLCIACHDFKADETGDPFFRTKDLIVDFLRTNNFKIIAREDNRPHVRDHVYATNTELT